MTPSPKILKTLLEFIFKGMDVLGYEENLDYDIAQSTNPDFNKAFVRVNIFKQYHEIIQVSLLSYFQSSNPDSLSSYIQPQDAHVLGQTELSHPIPMPPQLTRHFP